MPTCARVTSLGIYLYVALDLPVRPGLSDPGPFYDHYHYGPPGPLMQPFPRGSDRTSRYKCRVGRTAATRHATLDAARANAPGPFYDHHHHNAASPRGDDRDKPV